MIYFICNTILLR